jgi:hypothetical protein
MDEVGFGVQPTAVTKSYSLTPEPKGKKRRKRKNDPAYSGILNWRAMCSVHAQLPDLTHLASDHCAFLLPWPFFPISPLLALRTACATR